MVQKQLCEVISNTKIADDIFELVLHGSIVQEMTPGQFVHVRVADNNETLLRRPISIASIDPSKKEFTLLFRAEGKGTKLFSEKAVGMKVDVLGPLGNGFPIHLPTNNERVLLVGGGIGVPPFYETSKQLKQKGIHVEHVLGFQSSNVSFYQHAFEQLGPTHIATVDGSLGTKGFVTDVIEKNHLQFDYLFACGPTPMLKAIESKYPHERVYLSLEERMGCGIGACFACVCHLTSDPNGTSYVKVCHQGPVFQAGVVVL
jgi:dihydroorotate dehydrogenase electron transfer subunit